jgi:hypothetical protein
MEGLETYKARWKALDTLLGQMADTYAAKPAFPRQDTIVYLFKSLRAFGAGQFQFFYYGFNRADQELDVKDVELEICPDFPPADILMAVLEQIGNDTAQIQKAADQRLSGVGVISDTLAKADKLAYMAVKPAIDYAAVDEFTTVLTYFEKNARFYRVPYAQVASIALPFSCATSEDHRDFLAIPHEVGHYIYRHPIGNVQKKLEDARKNPGANLPANINLANEYKDYIKNTFEETFADIYGCLIAGPVIALDFQELALANSNEAFKNGDGEHPNPALRPLIYNAVLANDDVDKRMKKIAPGNSWKPIAKKLEKRWYEKLADRGIKEYAIRTSTTAGDTTTIRSHEHDVDTAHQPVDAGPAAVKGTLDVFVQTTANTILTQILKYGKANRPRQGWLPLTGWAGNVDNTTEPDDLFESYEKNFEALLTQVQLQAPDADPNSVRAAPGDLGPHTTALWVKWVLNENPTFKTWPPAGPIKCGQVKDPEDRGTWGHIVHAGRWVTKGPWNDGGFPRV